MATTPDMNSGACEVCQRPNRTYYTYLCQSTGHIICTACRIFYVDSVRQNIYTSYDCREKQKCNLAVKRGKYLCKYCKFQKCQEVGLTQDSIKPARKYHQTDNNEQQVKSKPKSKKENKLNLAKKAWTEKIQKNYEDAVSKMVLEESVLDSICEGHCVQWISTRHSNDVMSCIQQASALALKTLENDSTFQSLCRADQILLFKNNIPLFGMYLLAKYLTAPTGFDQLHVLITSLYHTNMFERMAFGVMSKSKKISYVEFNHDGILIKEDELLNQGSFYNLLDAFADEGSFPTSLNALFLLKLILSTDHWLYNDYKRLQELKKIKGFEDQIDSLLKLDIGFKESDESEEHQSDFVQRIFRILFSMTQVINPQAKKCYRMNSSSGLSLDETNMVIGLTNMVKSVFAEESGDQDYIWKMEALKKGQFITEYYAVLKRHGQIVLKQRCIELLKSNFDCESSKISSANFEDALLLCHVKCAGLKTFGDQLKFFIGRDDHNSTLSSSPPFNIGYILDKLQLIPKETIGDYNKSIGQMQKFLAVPEVFALFLFYLLTKQGPQLVSLHSFVEEMLSKLAQQALVFQDEYATSQEILQDFKRSFEDFKDIMIIWRSHSLQLRSRKVHSEFMTRQITATK